MSIIKDLKDNGVISISIEPMFERNSSHTIAAVEARQSLADATGSIQYINHRLHGEDIDTLLHHLLIRAIAFAGIIKHTPLEDIPHE